MLTRRGFLGITALAVQPASVVVPLDIVFDGDAKLSDDSIGRFWALWAEAARDFAWCGVFFKTRERQGSIFRPANRQPAILGLEHGVLNLVVTGSVPIEWDNGRMLRGVTTRYRGHHLSLIGLNRADRHRIPFLAVNTCVHEVLHALLLDIFEWNPGGVTGQGHEARVDWLATRLWLFHSGAGIRESARIYVERLRASGD